METKINMKLVVTGVSIGAALLATIYAARVIKGKKSVIETIEAMRKKSVLIKDPGRVEKKLNQLKGGRDKLQVMSLTYSLFKPHTS